MAPYNYLPTRRPLTQPFSRVPLDGSLFTLNGMVSSDLHLINFLEGCGVTYGVISDTEFARSADTVRPSLVLFNNHSEYWAYEGIGRVRSLLANGTSLMFLSDNNMYRGVVTDDDALIVMEQQLPRATIEPLLSTFYSQSGYHTYGSFRVLQQDHWVFDGTQLTNGDTFGDGVISGVETDKLSPYSEGFTLLAIGDNAARPVHMVIKEFDGGNFLVNSSSISSVRALPTDAAWQRVLQNLIERATAGATNTSR